MRNLTVLFGTVLLLAVAMSAAAGGIKDVVDEVIDPALTDEVEQMLERSPLRDYAGLDPTPIPPPPVPVNRIPTELRSIVPTGIPAGGTAYVGASFVEIPLIIEDGHVPLTDLDALYGVSGPPPVVVVPVLPDAAAPPADLVDDTPALVAWANPPLDIK